MNPADSGTAPTRRQLRERAQARTMPPAPDDPLSGIADTAPRTGTAAEPDPASPNRIAAPNGTGPNATAQWAEAGRPATALTWVDPGTLLPRAGADPEDDGRAPDLLAGAPRRSPLRPAVILPAVLLVGLASAYAATTLLWPLHRLAPVVSAMPVGTQEVAAAAPAWPGAGSAAIGVEGFSSLASTGAAVPIASITKVVSSLMVLERMPLQPGEEGPAYAFTAADSEEYWDYRIDDQSALDVPVGGVLTQYQLLQGTLMGSANNYIDFLAGEIWSSDRDFAEAAEIWLADRGLEEIRVTSPSGLDEDNTSTPEALLRLAQRALQNPVIAGIVGTPAVELPGAGLVTNTNPLLTDPGVVGVKTGTLTDYYGLLVSKDLDIDGTTVRVHAAVLGQPDVDTRSAVSRALFDQVEAELRERAAAVPRGTVVGTVTTRWGAEAQLVTDSDARPVLWNGAAAHAASALALGEDWEAGGDAGSLTVAGPVDERTVAVSLAAELAEPSPWWRLTHPLQLLGLAE